MAERLRREPADDSDHRNLRSLLTKGTPGPDIGVALAWAVGILVVSYTLAVCIYRLRAPAPAAQ